MNHQQLLASITKTWDQTILPTLVEYVKIPNKSPLFDKNWEKNGYMEQAIQLVSNWCLAHAPNNMHLEVIKLPGLTPLLFIDIPGQCNDTILFYGHLDKQPEMTGWAEDLGPWKPVIKDDKLYGRGSADDGYAIFSSLTAIKTLQDQNIPHARCVILIECSEESGSPDLPAYLKHINDKLGNPSFVICLDSAAGNYDQFWMTTSLRGNISGTLSVEVLSEGVHSGVASGVVPSTFRIARELLNRIEDEKTGEMKLPELNVKIPADRLAQIEQVADILGSSTYTQFPFLPGVKPTSDNLTQLIIDRTWNPKLAVTGAGGLPAIEDAGNVLRPYTKLKLSVRTPPTCDVMQASNAIKETLETNPPYNAKVSFNWNTPATGWNAPEFSPWLNDAINEASEIYFNQPAAYMGEGATIPFMSMLGIQFPQAQFLITGVLGPHSNAHGPNEFLHIPYVKKITACIASVIARHGQKEIK